MSSASDWHWHARAFFARRRWAATRQRLEDWLLDVPRGPALPADLVLLGGSAGWMMSSRFLSGFQRVLLVDIDPWAGRLFRINHGSALARHGVKLDVWQGDAHAPVDDVARRRFVVGDIFPGDGLGAVAFSHGARAGSRGHLPGRRADQRRNPQLLQHLAQSIEYSMKGYPEMKSAAFRAVLGNAAFAVFNARGAMSHSLTEPIPGAPALDAKVALKDSVRRLLDALAAFEAWSGALRPHFAYGELDKAQYTRAHLMHLANHWTQFHAKTAVA